MVSTANELVKHFEVRLIRIGLALFAIYALIRVVIDGADSVATYFALPIRPAVKDASYTMNRVSAYRIFVILPVLVVMSIATARIRAALPRGAALLSVGLGLYALTTLNWSIEIGATLLRQAGFHHPSLETAHAVSMRLSESLYPIFFSMLVAATLIISFACVRIVRARHFGITTQMVIGTGIIAPTLSVIALQLYFTFLATDPGANTFLVTSGISWLAMLLYLLGIVRLWRITPRLFIGATMPNCPRCGYSIEGAKGTVCPECGLDCSEEVSACARLEQSV